MDRIRIVPEGTVASRDRLALRKRIEKLSAATLNDSKDLATALLIINESLQDLAARVIELERVVAQKKRTAK